MSKKQVKPGEKHFTVSIFIITKEKPHKVLLVHHKKYDLWIQPGGHIEEGENPVEAAVREAREETGIDISFLSSKVKTKANGNLYMPIPKYLMEQVIPAFKDSPSHFHIDHMFLVKVPFQKVIHQEEESHNIGWFGLKEVERLNTFPDLKIILSKLLK